MNVLHLAFTMFIDTLFTFGNGPTMVPLLQKDLVDQQHVLTQTQLLYAFTIARITPGQANLYVASIGYMLYGVLGAVITILAILLPGYVMIPLMSGYERFKDNRSVKQFITGLTAASVGLIVASTVQIGKTSLTGIIPWIVCGLTIFLIQILKWNPILSLGLASLIGITAKLLQL